MLMLVGTYTANTGSEGIYAFEVATDCRKIDQVAVNRGIENPSWLVRHPALPFVYSVNELRGDEGGSVSAFRYDTKGNLTLEDKKPSLGGDPCHLAIDAAGAMLVVSNYTGGNFATYPIDAGGRLGSMASFVQHGGHGVDPVRQKSPHVHSATLDCRGRFAWIADLGIDQLVRYPLSTGGQVDVGRRVAWNVRPGAGPRHFCFSGSGEYGYLINELDNTIVVFGCDTGGDLVELQTVSALPDDYEDASYCAHIQLSADDRCLYGSNRGHDSIVMFRTYKDGKLKLAQHHPSGGSHPRHFALTPDERHLVVANRDADNLVVLARDPETGELEATGTEVSVPAPVCVLFL